MWERYREELHELEMDGERREDLVELLAAELEGNAEGRAANAEAMQRRRRKGAPLKAALLLAACMAVGIGTALAASTHLTTGEALDALLQGSPAATRVIDSIGRPVDAAATSNGVTIKAEAVAGDEQSYSVVYSISWEDGIPELASNPEYAIVLEGGSHVQGAEDSSSYVYAYDTNPDDNTVCYVEQTKLRSPAELAGRTCKVRFNRIVAVYRGENAQPGGSTRVTIAEGRWEFRFVVDYEECGVELCEGGPVEGPGWSEVSLTSAKLTPLALQFEFDVTRDGSQFIEVSKRVKEAVGSCEILLADASVLSFGLSACPANTSGNGESLLCDANIPFEGIIDIGAVRSVKLGGVTLKP